MHRFVYKVSIFRFIGLFPPSRRKWKARETTSRPTLRWELLIILRIFEVINTSHSLFPGSSHHECALHSRDENLDPGLRCDLWYSVPTMNQSNIMWFRHQTNIVLLWLSVPCWAESIKSSMENQTKYSLHHIMSCAVTKWRETWKPAELTVGLPLFPVVIWYLNVPKVHSRHDGVRGSAVVGRPAAASALVKAVSSPANRTLSTRVLPGTQVECFCLLTLIGEDPEFSSSLAVFSNALYCELRHVGTPAHCSFAAEKLCWLQI